MVKTDDLRPVELAGWSPILWTPVLVGIFFDDNLLLPLDGLVQLLCCCPLINTLSFNKPDTCGALLGAKEIEPAICIN